MLGTEGLAVAALLETDLPGLPKRTGKVRDVYDLGGDRLLIVATDRISAYDWVLPDRHPGQGPGPDRPQRLLVRAARREPTT